MKLMHFSRAAKGCGWYFALILLVLGRSASGQSYFMLPPIEQGVRITSPANHSTFYSPVDLPLFAFAFDTGRVVNQQLGYPQNIYTNVEFYAATASQTNDLGPGFGLGSTNSVPRPIYGVATFRIPVEPRLAALYCLVWTNAPAGTYTLTAVARGPSIEEGLPPFLPQIRTSAPVNITIVAGVTNANPADMVSIAATDPVAIAGTNTCWIWKGNTNATPAWTNWPPVHWGYETNWGPKNAVFTVRRIGNAISNLTVNYSVGGTASNGVDYVDLPGSVTIPAGEAYSLIPVIPLDAGVTNFSKTVVLTLLADTNTPPAYTKGLPASAAALIVDYWPRPLPWMLTDRLFHFNLSTNFPDGAWYLVQNSTDLVHWTTVATNQVINGSVDYVDPNAPNSSRGYYRYVALTNAPAN